MTRTPDLCCHPEVAMAMLESVYVHRLLSTGQLHALHLPHTSLRWTQRVLAELRKAGLLDRIRSRPPKGPEGLWFCTEKGATVIDSERVRPRFLVDVDIARGPLQAHTLAVNAVGVAFVASARRYGHECGPLAWRNEVSHPLSERPSGERLIADALLHYEIHQPGQRHLALAWFVELDRATMPTAAVAAKLRAYRRFAQYVPAARGGRPSSPPSPLWRAHYATLPDVLMVFTGKPLSALWSRIEAVVDQHNHDPLLRDAAQPRVWLTTLEELTTAGPFAAIFCRPEQPDELVDILGRPAPPAKDVAEADSA